jgi:hypothetical protein
VPHRFDDVSLIVARQAVEHVRYGDMLSCINRVEDTTAFRAETEMGTPPVRFGRTLYEETPSLEFAYDPAQVRRIEREILAQHARRELVPMSQLVEDTNIRERELTIEEAAIQRSDLPRVEAIESPNPRDADLSMCRHADYCRQISGLCPVLGQNVILSEAKDLLLLVRGAGVRANSAHDSK